MQVFSCHVTTPAVCKAVIIGLFCVCNVLLPRIVLSCYLHVYFFLSLNMIVFFFIELVMVADLRIVFKYFVCDSNHYQFLMLFSSVILVLRAKSVQDNS